MRSLFMLSTVRREARTNHLTKDYIPSQLEGYSMKSHLTQALKSDSTRLVAQVFSDCGSKVSSPYNLSFNPHIRAPAEPPR